MDCCILIFVRQRSLSSADLRAICLLLCELSHSHQHVRHLTLPTANLLMWPQARREPLDGLRAQTLRHTCASAPIPRRWPYVAPWRSLADHIAASNKPKLERPLQELSRPHSSAEGDESVTRNFPSNVKPSLSLSHRRNTCLPAHQSASSLGPNRTRMRT